MNIEKLGMKGIRFMDRVQKALYESTFMSDFHTKVGTEFQKWFEELAKHAYGDNFEIIIPDGNKGDWKCDGRRLDTNTIFQCHAPETPSESVIRKKIKEDFAGAKEHWGTWMKEWVFVHNQRGLYPDVSQLLEEMRKENANINIVSWSLYELENLKNEMSQASQLKMFGAGLTMEDFMRIKIPDLVPVIESLHSEEVESTKPLISPPSLEKLERNKLSTVARDIIEIGRIKSSLVAKYFEKTPNIHNGEQIAEAIRNKYSALKQQNLTSEQIFWEIEKIIRSCGESDMFGAQLAVLTYFFDTCDILENPEDWEK